MSLRHELGNFPFVLFWPSACWAPQCKYSRVLMQKCSARSLSHFLFLPHIQPLSLTDFMDVRCLTFSLVECTPLLSPFSLPSFASSLWAVFCPASLHAWPALPWLLTSKSYFIHQSLIRERGPFSAALKEKEGTRSECIKKRGNKCMKRGHKRERGFALDPRGTSGVTKAKKGHTPTHLHTVTLSHTHSFCFGPVGCVQMLHTWSLLPFLFCPISYFPHSFHWQYKEESRKVSSCNPSLHLDVCSIMCCFPSFLLSDHSPPVFSSHLCAHWHSPFFSISLYFEVAGKLVFRSVGIAIASPLSWSLAHTQLHTNTHLDAHTFSCITLSLCERLIQTCGCVVLYTVA